MTTTRQQLIDLSEAEFLKAHTKTSMIEMATEIGLEDPQGTKGELYTLLVDNSSLPDASLRGRSTVEGPVALVWAMAEASWAESVLLAEDPPRRKDVVARCVEAGIAPHTARTQYQAFFKATNRGERRLADFSQDELPKALREEVVVA